MRITNALSYVKGGSTKEIYNLLNAGRHVWLVCVVTDSDGEENPELVAVDCMIPSDIEEIIDSDDFLGYMVI